MKKKIGEINMNWIDQEREFNYIKAWASDNHDSCLGERGYVESAFSLCDDQNDISEYGFRTIPEFQNIIKKLWETDEVMLEVTKTISVAVFKGRKEKNRSAEGERMEIEMVVPDYIYNF